MHITTFSIKLITVNTIYLLSACKMLKNYKTVNGAAYFLLMGRHGKKKCCMRMSKMIRHDITKGYCSIDTVFHTFFNCDK